MKLSKPFTDSDTNISCIQDLKLIFYKIQKVEYLKLIYSNLSYLHNVSNGNLSFILHIINTTRIVLTNTNI